MPPNLLAHYLDLWETTVVRQTIETARASVSSGGHSSSYWCQQRQLAVVGQPDSRNNDPSLIEPVIPGFPAMIVTA
jgi:hypothetical protein